MIRFSDCIQIDFQIAEGFGKQSVFRVESTGRIYFCRGKQLVFEALLPMEPVCYYICFNSSKS